MPYPNTVDTGQSLPWALYDGDLSASNAAAALAANTAWLVGVYAPNSCVLTGLRVRFSSGGAGTYDIGIYDASGNLLYHSGATASATGLVTATLATPLPLAPGRYSLAFWSSNATDTLVRSVSGANLQVVQSGTSAGGLPAITAGLTGLANATFKPVIIGLLQGGWS